MTDLNSLVLDNGAFSIKFGNAMEEKPDLIPNAVFKSKSERRKVFVGKEVDDCTVLSGLYYMLPFQKGYLVNWDVQRQIWDHVFTKSNVDYGSNVLWLTEPVFNFTSIRESELEVFLEEYGFSGLACITAPTCSAHHYSKTHSTAPCSLVIDVGYSFTHIVPFYQNRCIVEGICRIDVGGKLLTNYLKEIVSYRQLQVLDETFVMNQVKEDVCFVSSDLYSDMDTCKQCGSANTISVDYVLPDYTNCRRGYIRQEKGTDKNEQALRLSNERFTVPELLFHPADIGIHQMGIHEAVIHSIEATPKQMHPQLFSNILVTGGSSYFKGFAERLQSDIRKLTPFQYEVQVTTCQKPDIHAWMGGCDLAREGVSSEWVVSASEYKENGSSLCVEKWDSLQTTTFQT